MASTPKLALIDSHALIHRAYHALPPMQTRAGVPTNAAYGFVAMLLKMFSVLKPTHVVAAFDSKGPTFRTAQFAAYKAHRKAAPDDLIVQFDLVRRIVRAFNIPLIEQPGFEADDIIGTLVYQLNSTIKKVIVTGDADTFQLITPTTSIFTLKRGVTDTVLYDEAAFQVQYGFAPTLLPDYKGLRGDPSDNIPGVPGIGEKTAKELVATYGSVENIFAKLDTLPARFQKKLAGHKDEALLSRSLSTIRTDVPLEFSLAAAKLDEYDPAAVKTIFAELEFKSFLQKLPVVAKGYSDVAETESAPVAMPENYHLVESEADKTKLRQELKQVAVLAVDTETEYLSARQAPIVGLSLAAELAGKLHAWYVPVTRQSVTDWKEVLENPTIAKVGHNLKYDYTVLQQSGITLQPLQFDSMIGSYLLRAGARQHNLNTVALEELGKESIPIESLIGTGKNQKKMSEVPLSQLAHYSCEDAAFSYEVYQKLQPKIKEQGLTRVFAEIEMPLIAILAAMEQRGIKLDATVLKQLEKKFSKRLAQLQQEIWQQAGREFNVNSTKQLRAVLYDELKLATAGIARKQSGFSTAASELGKLKGLHPIIDLIEEHRELAKLLSTYVVTLPQLIDQETGRLHTSFNQTIAATGRLSSTDPNLQNIPIRTELGQSVRAAFVAEPGKKLIKADYSQLELRLAAHIAQDEKMITAFRAGEDIHAATAGWVYGIPAASVTTMQRRLAKTLNFGVLYGMGAKKFAREAKVSVGEAQEFINRYRQHYTGVTRLLAATIDQARTLGYVETLFGRRRYIPEINSHSLAIRAQAERIAFNFPMQGTEADLLKKAMIALDRELQENFPDAGLVLTVHDELVVEAPAKHAKAIAPLMKKIMENIYTLDVPLIVDVAVGDNWKEMEEVK